MKIDETSLAFGYSFTTGAGNPNWSIALGQSHPSYKINLELNPGLDKIIVGMAYCSIPVSKVTTRMGKGAPLVSGNENDTPIVSAAFFSKVEVNGTKIKDGKFVLLIDKDHSKSHYGRLRLRYSKHTTYTNGPDTYTNDTFFAKVRETFGLAEDACWFVYDISVDNQDTLCFKAKIVNKDGPETYADSKALHAAWDIDDGNGLTSATKVTSGENIILYGVPGCGKSNEIKTKYCNDKKYMERVVFHPDYTYSDFIGQILPKSDGEKISYPFTPGPFTVILQKAIEDPNNMYYLVIEEINRGNAPAIFGEVFQLLDREGGESEYGITNFDIAGYIYGDDRNDEEIKIPGNLTVLATMNTADQNVFTLDTAFKRRWSMRSIRNDIAGCKHANEFICGTGVTWREFAEKINDKIIDIGEGNLSSEDNRLGAYFIKGKELSSIEVFSEKILMYLWNDAFKYDRQNVFNPKYRTLEELVEGFSSEKFNIFDSKFGFANTAPDDNVSSISADEYLSGKASDLIALYKEIFNRVKSQVKDAFAYTTTSKQYIGIGSTDCTRKSFAEVMFKNGCLAFEIEKPDNYALLELGEEITYNGSHDHYFKIIVNQDSNLDDVVYAIVASYQKLKKDN